MVISPKWNTLAARAASAFPNSLNPFSQQALRPLTFHEINFIGCKFAVILLFIFKGKPFLPDVQTRSEPGDGLSFLLNVEETGLHLFRLRTECHGRFVGRREMHRCKITGGDVLQPLTCATCKVAAQTRVGILAQTVAGRGQDDLGAVVIENIGAARDQTDVDGTGLKTLADGFVGGADGDLDLADLIALLGKLVLEQLLEGLGRGDDLLRLAGRNERHLQRFDLLRAGPVRSCAEYRCSAPRHQPTRYAHRGSVSMESSVVNTTQRVANGASLPYFAAKMAAVAPAGIPVISTLTPSAVGSRRSSIPTPSAPARSVRRGASRASPPPTSPR